MIAEEQIKDSLRQWVLNKSQDINPELLDDDTRILEKRIISSVQLMDLIMYLEHLRDAPINVKHLKPGVFNSINSIYKNFFMD